ncbi:hypothetical protein ACFQZ4_26440 [Catellatospora coxensis]
MGLFRKSKQDRSPAAVPVAMDTFFHDPGAARLRRALLDRDWPTARDLLSGAPDSDTRALYVEIAAKTPGVQEWIEGPIRDEPGTLWPLLLRGAHAVRWAWRRAAAARLTRCRRTPGKSGSSGWFWPRTAWTRWWTSIRAAPMPGTI